MPATLEASGHAPDVCCLSCGCAGPPRRVCDICYSPSAVFLACSLACLERHRYDRHAHDGALGDSAERARAAARASNRRFPDSWQGYAGHRERVMNLIQDLPAGAEICVFGAGNCSDLDLGRLAKQYREIHLVDLDGEALERSRERQPLAVRNQLILHPGVDLSGLLEHLDDWGEHFPDRAELGRCAVTAAQRLVRELGQSFLATISTCALSQLALPFRRAWVTSRSNWADLLSAINALHLATLAGSTARGGQGVIVFDTSSSRDTPQLAEQRGRGAEALEAFVVEARAHGSLTLHPEPEELRLMLASPGLSSLVAEPRVGLPWLWELGDATQLVYSLSFRHP